MSSSAAVPVIVTIEGNIGSGKSTLLAVLRQWAADQSASDRGNETHRSIARRMVFVTEPVDVWTAIKDSHGDSILAKFYRDPATYAFSFQMMAYITRLSLVKRALTQDPDKIIVCERSIHTDKHVFASMLRDDGLIEDVNFQIYTKWFDEFADLFKTVESKVVYVQADPRVCFARILKRAREGERVGIEYLEKCNRYHDAWLAPYVDKLVLDGNAAKPATVHDYVEWIDKVISLVQE